MLNTIKLSFLYYISWYDMSIVGMVNNEWGWFVWYIRPVLWRVGSCFLVHQHVECDAGHHCLEQIQYCYNHCGWLNFILDERSLLWWGWLILSFTPAKSGHDPFSCLAKYGCPPPYHGQMRVLPPPPAPSSSQISPLNLSTTTYPVMISEWSVLNEL